MVLAGYGGASLLFFGVSPSAFGAGPSTATSPPTSFSAAMAREKTVEEANLTNAVDASEAEAAGDGEFTGSGTENSAQQEYSWWDVLLGKHDQEIFERSTAHVDDSSKNQASAKKRNRSKMKATAVSLVSCARNDIISIFSSKVIGKEHFMPRFWVLTDHSRAQVVLVIRGRFTTLLLSFSSSQHIGTMSLNEIAVDLTCDAETFRPASTPSSTEQNGHSLPGQFTFPSISEKEVTADQTTGEPEYHVHGGMLKMTKLMGDIGKPVQLAVLDALQNNPDYGLFVYFCVRCGELIFSQSWSCVDTV